MHSSVKVETLDAAHTVETMTADGVTHRSANLSERSFPLLISRIEARDLKNVEIIGKNDPFVTIKMDTFEYTTHHLEGAGSNVEWDFALHPITINASDALLNNVAMDIKVYDHNNMRSHTLIGESMQSLKHILSDAHGKEIPIDFSIINHKGQVTGYVTMYLNYMKKTRNQCDPLCGINVAVACKTSLDFVADFLINLFEFVFNYEPIKDLDASTFAFKHAKIAVHRIEVKNASAVDGLSKNDLYCTIVCSELDLRTATWENIGAAAAWDIKEDNVCEVSSNDKDTVKCRVEVWDENTMRSNTLIGVAEVSIRPLFDHIGTRIKQSFTAFAPNGKHSADVVLTMEVLNH